VFNTPSLDAHADVDGAERRNQIFGAVLPEVGTAVPISATVTQVNVLLATTAVFNNGDPIVINGV